MATKNIIDVKVLLSLLRERGCSDEDIVTFFSNPKYMVGLAPRVKSAGRSARRAKEIQEKAKKKEAKLDEEPKITSKAKLKAVPPIPISPTQ